MKKLYIFLISSLFIFCVWTVPKAVHGQINIMPGPTVTPIMMVENIIGEGITYDNVQFQGAPVSRGIFTNGQSTNLGIASGIFLTSGSGFNIPGPNTACAAGTNNGTPGHPLLTAITTNTTYDASVLSFDFVPESDTMRFRYVFGSEEYNEWVGSNYNDVFGYFVSGPNPMGGNYTNKNIAIIPGTANTSVTINNVNNGYSSCGTVPNGPCMNCAYYNDNTGGLTLQYDGKTVVLTAWVLTVPCETYHIVIGVADAGDGIYDSGVFIEENSFESPKISVELEPYPAGVSETMIEGCVSAEVIFTLPDPSYAPVTICFEITGTATNGVDYLWIDNCITFEEGQDTAVINVVPLKDDIIEGDETIILIIENILGCIVRYDTITFIISDYIDMVSVTTPNTAVCQGQEVQLYVQVYNGIPPYTYEWDGFEGLNADSIIVFPDTTTWYFIDIIDMCMDTISDSIQVIVFPIPEVDLGEGPLNLCEGDTIMLDAGEEGVLGYFWQDGTGGQYHAVTEPGLYFVTVAGQGGCTNSDSIFVTETIIDIDIGPDTAICIGESVVFTAPGGFDSYKWQNGSTGQSFTASETGNYWVEVTLGECSKVDSVFLFVDDPALGVELGNDTTVCPGTSITLQPTGIYSSYLWSTGATTQSITVTQPGTYTLWVTSGCGEAEGTIKINNWPAPVPNLGPDQQLCFGEGAILNPGSFLSYQWQDNSSNPFYTVTQGGLYYVTVTSVHGCKGSDSVFVQIGSVVDLLVADTLLLCEGETITLNAQSGFDNYLWSDGTTNTTNITVDEGGWAAVYVSYNYGCPSADSVYIDAYPIPEAIITGEDMFCEGDTIWLSAPDGDFKYAWNNVETNQPTYMVLQGGTYELKMYNVCGEDYDTKTVQVNQLPNVNLGQDRLLFPGESVTLDAGNFLSFVWNGNPNLNGQFLVVNYEDVNKKDSIWVEVFDEQGCKNTDAIVIEIFDVDVPIVITPNGDGMNDRFEPGEGWSGVQQHTMMVFNRWGEKIWESSDFQSGWDGKHNGRLVAEGTYFWVLEVSYGPSKTKKTYRGSLTVLGTGI